MSSFVYNIKAFILVYTLSLINALTKYNQIFTSDQYIPWVFGKCLVPTVQEDFQPEKFFKDYWYQQSSYGNILFQADGICPTVQYTITDTGKILELNYHFDISLTKYVMVYGNSDKKFIKNGQGYLPFTYFVAGGLVSVEVPMFIVGTDYDNWAVVYYCKQQLSMKAEMSWIMTRKRNGTDQQQDIRFVLEKNNMDITDYIKAVNTGCVPGEPHL